jgi:hypothetical protein
MLDQRSVDCSLICHFNIQSRTVLATRHSIIQATDKHRGNGNRKIPSAFLHCLSRLFLLPY